ncbi:MAG TPA: tetratricopeptide repeat protein [Longimicrobiales bacterium]|nr:tetratricopeptide repeat protein [Longimicrobiales bacterium]
MADSHREEIAKLEGLYAGNPGGRVFVHLAEAYRKAGEHERARRILDEGLARHPDSASGYVVLGRVLADMQITAEAEIAFRRVLELDGGNLVALRWLGDIARQAGRNADAALHYRELLIRNPSNEEVRDLVEIVEREAAGETASEGAAAADIDEHTDDAFAGLVLESGEGAELEAADADAEREAPAVSAPISEAEEPAVTPPATAPDDITPWSAAPGQTGDAEEPPVEYGLVELDTIAAEGEVTNEPPAAEQIGERRAGEYLAQSTFDAAESAADEAEVAPDAAEPTALEHAAEPAPEDLPGHWGAPRAEDESDFVASIDDDDAAVLEIDDLRRIDEAEPVEIHLLDPSYEPSAGEDEDEYVDDLDLSDLANAGSLPDADDYADESFVADLSGAGREPPPPDELPVAVDVMDASLTLLPGDDESHGTADAEQAAFAGGEAAEPEASAQSAEEDAHEEPDFIRSEFEPAGDLESLDYAEAFESGATGADEPPETESDTAQESATAEPLEPAAAEPLEPATAEPLEPAAAEPRSYGAFDAIAGETEVDAADHGRADLMGLAGAAEPAAESAPVAEVRRGSEPGLVTETMAVLYRSQGFHDRAADVYRALLRARPNDERLAAKLREAEEAAGGPAGAAPPPRQEDEAGEVWLHGVGAAWTAPADTAAGEATPYAWTGESDEPEAGEPISAYLQDLVSWKAGSQGPWTQPEPVSANDASDEVEMPDWLNGPGKTEAWTPDTEPVDYPPSPAAETEWSAPAEQEPWEQAPVAGEAFGTDEAVGTDEPMSPSEPISPGEPMSAGEPGALAGEAGGLPGDEAAPEAWSVPADADTAAVGEAAVTGSDTGGGWTPLELENDVPPAAAASTGDASDLQPTALPEDDSSEDDDLDMFRSWLQSLRK